MAVTVLPALRALLPSLTETALLRACLHDGDAARAGWQQWLGAQTAPVTSGALCRQLAPTRTLLPLLARSAARNHLPLEPGVQAYVRAAALREELRASRFRELTHEALAALADAAITPHLLRGAALAATVYDDWAHRHCHDLDLLVESGQHAAARWALRVAGFAPGSVAGGSAVMEHAAGFQLTLHTQPFAVPFYHGSFAAFTRGGRTVSLDGCVVAVPSPEAMLVHVLGHASYSASRRHLRWVADAWLLAARHPQLDWDDVIARVSTHRLELPAAVLLDYLAELGVAVPADVLRAIQERATLAGPLAQDVALGALTAALQGDVARMWRASPSWRARLRLARWAVAPSPAYLRGTVPNAATWLLPLCYVYRPWRFVAGRMAARTAAADEQLEAAS